MTKNKQEYEKRPSITPQTIVLRQESLQDDLKHLEQYLKLYDQRPKQQSSPLQQSLLSLYPNDNIHYVTDTVSVSSVLNNKENRRQLCCVLFSNNQEYSIYMTLLQQSINLSWEDKLHTYIQSLQICGLDTTDSSPNLIDRYSRMMKEFTLNDWKRHLQMEICESPNG
jgi:hypothetical protein